ncbi:MAG: tyrosine-type recombinase/integrase [Clostridium sp.]|uniref:tyrosine-type recombinase/integrase n=1 Tax=Clostridium sp. TaxID=1506 RepID=UPI0029093C20|nr:tyrosine-type recombinase/integrase [Clostridium sp.]MDU7339292.1 tyrosine-type recombinase/integrase [Clostridium sp.]
MELNEKYGKQTLTLEETAKELGVSVPDLDHLIENGELCVKKIGNLTIVPISVLERYLGLEESAGQSYDTKPNNEEEVFKMETPYGTGSILYVKARNVFRYAISNGKDAVTGKRNRIIKGDFYSREEAEEALRNALKEMGEAASGSGVAPTVPIAPTTLPMQNAPRITVRDYLDRHLFTMFTAPTARTKHCYATSAKLIVKSKLGDMYLDELTRMDIQEFLNSMSHMSQSTLDKIRLVLRKMTAVAAEDNLIPKDVGRMVKKAKSTQRDLRSDDEKVYSKEQINAILSHAKQDSDPMIYTVLILETLTGMRPEEVRALLKTDVNFATCEIHIHQAAIMKPILGSSALSKTTGRECAIGPTKSPAGVRTLQIGEYGIEAIQEWLGYLEKNHPAKYQNQFLFPSSTDVPMRDDVLNTAFNRFKKRHGFGKEYTLYKFRHTFATTLAESGVSVKTAMRLMGDSTTNVILGVYTHVRSDEAKRTGQQINQVYCDMLSLPQTEQETIME